MSLNENNRTCIHVIFEGKLIGFLKFSFLEKHFLVFKSKITKVLSKVPLNQIEMCSNLMTFNLFYRKIRFSKLHVAFVRVIHQIQYYLFIENEMQTAQSTCMFNWRPEFNIFSSMDLSLYGIYHYIDSYLLLTSSIRSSISLEVRSVIE